MLCLCYNVLPASLPFRSTPYDIDADTSMGIRGKDKMTGLLLSYIDRVRVLAFRACEEVFP